MTGDSTLRPPSSSPSSEGTSATPGAAGSGALKRGAQVAPDRLESHGERQSCMGYLLIAGLPGTGKTEFSRWLAETHQYVHIEVDAALETDPAVQLLLHRDVFNVGGVAENLKARGPDVVLDWGFVPSLLGRVRQLVRAGFEPWWFTGDEGAARQSFLESARAPEGLFDLQLADIHASWPRIEKVFDGR